MNIDEFIERAQESARKHRYHADFFDINNPMRVACIKSAEDCEQLAEWLEKLKEYQQLEEQGRLIKLPVKDGATVHRECVHIKSTCYHENYKCSECPLTELFCDEFYKAIDRCYEEAYASGCLAGMDLAKSEADKISTSPYYDGYSKALDDLLNSLPDCDYVGIERLVCLVEQLKRGGKNESSN